MREKIGGQIVFFYHDSDADYRETITVMRDRNSGQEARLNFLQENKIQKKFSPLYAKRVPAGWKEEIKKQLPRFMGQRLIDLFMSAEAKTVADFCLEMYRKMELLEGVEFARSGDRVFRDAASDLSDDYFADVNYQGEIVRAQVSGGILKLHEGGGKYLSLPGQPIERRQKSAGRDNRFEWMQSVIHCTHYIYGEGEGAYLRFDKFPNVKFIKRDEITEPEFAWLG